MGNIFSTQTYKICLKCNNKKHIRNDNLEIIDLQRVYNYDHDRRCENSIITFR